MVDSTKHHTSCIANMLKIRPSDAAGLKLDWFVDPEGNEDLFLNMNNDSNLACETATTGIQVVARRRCA